MAALGRPLMSSLSEVSSVAMPLSRLRFRSTWPKHESPATQADKRMSGQKARAVGKEDEKLCDVILDADSSRPSPL
jgi:hypothetical protein